jgi:hypothetical protein
MRYYLFKATLYTLTIFLPINILYDLSVTPESDYNFFNFYYFSILVILLPTFWKPEYTAKKN